MYCQVTLLGHLGEDVQLRVTRGGTSVAEVSLATSHSYKDGEGQTVRETEWHKLVFWGTLAETAEKIGGRGGKGKCFLVVGRIITQSWENDEGRKVSTKKIRVNSFQVVSKKPPSGRRESEGGYSGHSTGGGYRDRSQGRKQEQEQRNLEFASEPVDEDDDIPF